MNTSKSPSVDVVFWFWFHQNLLLNHPMNVMHSDHWSVWTAVGRAVSCHCFSDFQQPHRFFGFVYGVRVEAPVSLRKKVSGLEDTHTFWTFVLVARI